MSSGTQADLDWAGTDAAQGGAGASPANAPNTGAAGETYLSDEEILGIESPSPESGYGARSRHTGGASTHRGVIPNPPQQVRNPSSIDDAGNPRAQRGSSGKNDPRNDNQANEALHGASAQMPEWMRTVAADPHHGGEAQNLWREHQEFRAAFSSPEEARTIKELLPGGVQDVVTLREATQSVDRIDAAIFSGDARAQSEVVAELARANPAAFRSMFAEAAKVLAGMGTRGNEAGSREAQNSGRSIANGLTSESTLRETREGWGTLYNCVGVVKRHLPIWSATAFYAVGFFLFLPGIFCFARPRLAS